MSFVPKVIARDGGKAEIATASGLPNGKILRDAVTLDADNLGWFADLLEAWAQEKLPADASHTKGGDEVKFRYGGSDQQPVVTVLNYGPNGGSFDMAFDDIPKLVAAVRKAAGG